MNVDELYKALIGWPQPRPVETPAEMVADVRAKLAELRRVRELKQRSNA